MESPNAPSERKTLDERDRMSQLERLRHSCAHVMAAAIARLWPDAQFAAGPPVDNGFYYDVELEHRISPEDFPAIEAEMKTIIKANQPFEKVVVPREQAIEQGQKGRLGALADRPIASKFKLDLLQDIPAGEPISLFRSGDFVDLCAGPHVMRTGNIGAYKLTSVASAYYKGDERNPQLQRIYGTAFKTRAELDAWLHAQEEARKRDHRKIGKEMGLFTISPLVGPGLILWMPRGAVIRAELQTLMQGELLKRGYQPVYTPHIGSIELYKISGHFPFYKESQYPTIKVAENEEYLLKPMNCPHHIQIYAAQPRSYRELPVRLAEFGTVYRYEQSGELSGMTRVRGFTQDDAHLFCTPEQVEQEFISTVQLVQHIFTTLGLGNYRVQVSLRDPRSDKYTGDPATWDRAEEILKRVAKDLDLSHEVVQGEAAFYGPKIDFMVTDCLGREWQLGTVQLDYSLPDRFQLEYIGADNARHRPVMIHRAPFGSFERFVGILIEHYAGNFPLWLSPEQVRVLPIGEPPLPYAREVLQQLEAGSVRATIDAGSDPIKGKIRRAEEEKVHTMLIIGQKEQAAGSVALRVHGKGDQGVKPREEAIAAILQAIRQRAA